MKHIYTSKRNTLLILLATSVLTAFGQIRITDVDPATNAVTLHNYGGTTVDVSNYYFCNFPAYTQVFGMAVISGSTTMNPGADLSVTSTVNFNAGDGEFGLYTSNLFGSSSAIIDYMQWGFAGHQRETVAVSAGVWNAGEFINVPPPFEFTGGGGSVGAANWQTALGVDDLTAQNLFEFVKNPVEDNLLFRLSGNIQQSELTIYNLSGQSVYSSLQVNESMVSMDVSSLSQGLYFLQLTSPQGQVTKRFLKQ